MKQFRDTQYYVYEDGRIFNTTTKRWITPYKKLFSKTLLKDFHYHYILMI